MNNIKLLEKLQTIFNWLKNRFLIIIYIMLFLTSRSQSMNKPSSRSTDKPHTRYEPHNNKITGNMIIKITGN